MDKREENQSGQDAGENERLLDEAHKITQLLVKRNIYYYGLSPNLQDDLVSEVIVILVADPSILTRVEKIRPYLSSMIRHVISRYVRKKYIPGTNQVNIDDDETAVELADLNSNKFSSNIEAKLDIQNVLQRMLPRCNEIELKIIEIIQTSETGFPNKREISRRLHEQFPDITRYKSDHIFSSLMERFKKAFY